MGILLVVPPQVYLERIVEGMPYKSYWHFYPHFFDGVYPKGNFSWHHLWFLPYLLTMSLLGTPLFGYLRKENNPIVQQWINLLQRQALFLYLPILFLLLIELGLSAAFPVTLAFGEIGMP